MQKVFEVMSRKECIYFDFGAISRHNFLQLPLFFTQYLFDRAKELSEKLAIDSPVISFNSRAQSKLLQFI